MTGGSRNLARDPCIRSASLLSAQHLTLVYVSRLLNVLRWWVIDLRKREYNRNKGCYLYGPLASGAPNDYCGPSQPCRAPYWSNDEFWCSWSHIAETWYHSRHACYIQCSSLLFLKALRCVKNSNRSPTDPKTLVLRSCAAINGQNETDYRQAVTGESLPRCTWFQWLSCWIRFLSRKAIYMGASREFRGTALVRECFAISVPLGILHTLPACFAISVPLQ